MAAAGWLAPGEEVLATVPTVNVGVTANPGSAGAAAGIGVAGDLLVAGPLRKKLGKAWYGDEHAELPVPDPNLEVQVTPANTVIAVTNQHLMVLEWKGLGKLGERHAAAPVGECTMLTVDGGKSLMKHRIMHITFPTGHWVAREINMTGAGKAADAVVDAFAAAGGKTATLPPDGTAS